MSPRKPVSGDGSACELLLLMSLVILWLGVTAMLGSFSLLVWSGAIVMAAVLRPPHQRRRTPESVTDLVSVAVMWCVALGIAGLCVDLFAPTRWPLEDLSWALLAELAGFVLGFVWVLVVLSIQHLEQAVRRYDRTRPTV
jgi:Zn-dependent protease